MSDIRIRIGASVDASLRDVFRPLHEAAKKARQATDNETKAAGKSVGDNMSKGAKRAEEAFSRLAADVQGKGAGMLSGGTKAVQDFARESKASFTQAQRSFAAMAREIDRETRKMERNQARTSLGLDPVGRQATPFVGRAQAFGAARTALSFGARVAGSVASGSGVDLNLESHVKRNTGLQTAAIDLANAGFMAGTSGPNGMRQDSGAITAQVRDVANATAFDPTKAMEGLQAFVGKTGDLATGRDVLKDLAVLSKATGTNLEDMVDAAGDVSNALGDTDNRGEKIAQIMRSIAGQGKLGAVEIKDMATQMAKLGANAGQFEGDTGSNIALLGALAQEARQRGGASSATMAATSVASFVNTLKTNARAAEFKKATGVDVFNKQGMLRNPQAIIEEALVAKGMDPLAFKKIFANVQGGRAVEGFATIFRQNGGGEAGLAAVREEFERLRKAAMGQGEVMDSFNAAMKGTASKTQLVNNKMSEMAETLSGVVLTALKEFGPDIKFAGEKLAWLGGKIADTFKGLIGDTTADKDRERFAREAADVNAVGAARALGELAAPGTARDKRGFLLPKEADAGLLSMGSDAETALAKAVDDQKKKVAEERANFGGKSDEELQSALAYAKAHGGAANEGSAKQIEQFQKDERATARMEEHLAAIRSTNSALVDAIKNGTLKVVPAHPTPPPANSAGTVPGVTPTK